MSTDRWTRFEEKRVRHFAALGFSAERISCELGHEFGRSRGAVVGFCSRKGIVLNGDGRADSPERVAARKARPKAQKAVRPWRPQKPYGPDQTDSLIAPTGPGISLLSAEADSCRFVLGDPKSLMVCGEKTAQGRSYCAFHGRACVGI